MSYFNSYLNYRCIIIILVLLSMYSCVNTKRAIYFNNIQSSEFPDVDIQPIIQKNDLLNVSISSINPEEANIFNPTTSSIEKQQPAIPDYLVNRDGEISLPLIGKLKAAGLTQKQLTDNIADLLKKRELLKDPVVNVRMLNFRVTVLGEVARPTVITVPSEKISLLEAIGMAGDLTIFAKRDNVLLIRTKDGTRTTRRINLNAEDLFTSPYFYMETNDVLYIEPNKTKIGTSVRSQQTLPIILSSISIAAIIANIIISN